MRSVCRGSGREPAAGRCAEERSWLCKLSRAGACSARRAKLSRPFRPRLEEGRFSPQAAAAAAFIEALTRDPNSVSAVDVEHASAAGVEDDALAEAIYVAFMFNTINRVVDALGFAHRSDRDRRRGAAVLRRLGYRLPGFLLR